MIAFDQSRRSSGVARAMSLMMLSVRLNVKL